MDDCLWVFDTGARVRNVLEMETSRIVLGGESIREGRVSYQSVCKNDLRVTSESCERVIELSLPSNRKV